MNNIINIKKLEFKNIKFNIVMFLPFIALIYSMVMSLKVKSFNLVYLLINVNYKALLMICFVAIGIKIGRSKFEVMDSYNLKPFQIVLGKILLIFELALLISIIELIFMIGLGIYTGGSTKYILNASAGNIILIFVECIFAGTLGVVLGLFFNNIISYIISALVLFSVLTCSFSIDFMRSKSSYFGIDKAFDLKAKLIKAFTIDYFTGKDVNIATLFNFDSVFFSHQLMFLIVASILILISIIIINIKKNYFYKKLLFSVVFFCIAFFALIHYQIVNMPLPLSYNTFENNIIENNNYAISSYSMDINLNKNIENKCTINIVNKNIEKIDLKFNNMASINELKVNNIASDYKLTNNILTITLPQNIDNENLKIDLIYDLNVNYIDKFIRENYYVKQNGAMLTNNIYWYPTNSNMEQKEFDINITTKNKLISNLENYKINNNIYGFKGNSRDFFLMSGYIKEFDINDTKLIAYEGATYDLLKNRYEANKYSIDKDTINISLANCEDNINNIKDENGKISNDPLTQRNFKSDTVTMNTYKNRLSLLENNEIENPIYVYSQNLTFSIPENNPNEIFIYDNYVILDMLRLMLFE